MENRQKVNIPKEAKDMDVRQPDVLLSAFDLADNIVTKRYVSILDKLAIRVPDQKFISSEIKKQARILRVKKLVYDNNENNIQKLTNVYLSAAGSNSNIAIIVDSDGSKIDFFIGICEEESSDDSRESWRL